MRIIFIRHAEPDYEHNTLTPRGFREAELLSDRVPHWKVERFYSSPLERAKLTAEPSLRKMGRTAEIVDWMREFSYAIIDPTTGKRQVPWDFMPQYWTVRPKLYDKDQWMNEEPYLQKPEIYENYCRVCGLFDDLLKEHGYVRDGGIYRVEKHNDDTLVFFCHLGITCVLMSHLMGLSPVMLWQNIYIAPTGVTVLGSEERCSSIASFRAQVIGDTSHLRFAGEPASASGYFTDTFNG